MEKKWVGMEKIYDDLGNLLYKNEYKNGINIDV